jgi:translation elongation factor EF-1alpha
VAGETAGLVVSEIPSDFSDQQIIGEPDSLPRITRSVNADIFLFGGSSISEGEVVQCYLNSTEYSVKVSKILSRTNSETGKKVSSKILRLLPKEMGMVTLHFSQKVAIESFDKFPVLGRFMLVKDRRSIAFGIVR